MNYLSLALFWFGVNLLINKKSTIVFSKAYTSRFSKKIISKLKPIIKNNKNKSLSNAILSELAQNIAYIKNVAILGNSGNVSSATLLSELAEMSTVLSSTYINMSSYLFVNDIESAKNIFTNSVNLPPGPDLAALLCNWDSLSKDDLKKMLETCQSMVRDELTTRQKKRSETISEIIYFPVTLNCMLVLLNFIYVAYFAEELEALELLF